MCNKAYEKLPESLRKNDEAYEELLKSLHKNAEKICVDGLDMEVRNCADREKGRPDPRSVAARGLTREDFAERKEMLHPELWANETHLLGLKNPEGKSRLELMRAQFGWISSDRSVGIRTICRKLSGQKGEFKLYQYEIPSAKKDRPCLIFFHGGGFFAGDIATVENQCKLLAQRMEGVVFSVDYPLCPEHPFPEGFEACWRSVKWVYAHADVLGISREKIGVGGDSAGGNLSLVCTLRDRDEGSHMISYEALIYPGANMSEDIEKPVYWREEAYDNPFEDTVIAEEIRSVGELSHDVAGWYMPDGVKEKDPYMNPIEADFSGLPRTLVMTAEYDFLRMSCETLSKKLKQAGVESRHIRYGGIFHGTFDRLGYAPQVEDMLLEIAGDMKEL